MGLPSRWEEVHIPSRCVLTPSSVIWGENRKGWNMHPHGPYPRAPVLTLVRPRPPARQEPERRFSQIEELK
jgi:hypothetical protein